MATYSIMKGSYGLLKPVSLSLYGILNLLKPLRYNNILKIKVFHITKNLM